MQQISLILILTLWSSSLKANSFGRSLYFDADSSSIANESGLQKFSGNVVAIAPGTLISADTISLDKGRGLITADGHTVLITGDEVFIGDNLEFDLNSQDITIKQALLVAKEQAVTRKIVDELLGFTNREIEFEAVRRKRLDDLEKRRRSLLESLTQLPIAERNSSLAIASYKELLKDIDSTIAQPNPWIANLPPTSRKVFSRRREFWNQAKQEKTLVSGDTLGYFRLSGATISKRQGNDYSANAVSWSPCRCEQGEVPAWSVQSGEVKAQLQGYLDFYNPVIKIGDVPILYAPFLRLPLKNIPQSGFLVPSISSQTATGFVLGLPVYLRLSDQSELTIKPEIMDKRGFRLGAEAEYKFSDSFKFQFDGQAIRDRVWLMEAGRRTEIRSYYRQGLENAIQRTADLPVESGSADEFLDSLSNPSFWKNELKQSSCAAYDSISEAKECLNQEISNYLTAPGNEWRGRAVWNATRYLTPRLSLVTSGEMLSDHRYLEDLQVPVGFVQALEGVPFRSFATSRYRFNLDQESFYLGAFGSFSDHLLTEGSWAGRQTPLALNFRSQYLPWGNFKIMEPYTSFQFESRRIYERNGSEYGPTNSISLGGGRRDVLMIKTVTPLDLLKEIDSAMFFDLEARYFTHKQLASLHSNIQTAKYGLRNKIPLQGSRRFGNYISVHDFSFNNSLSIRPFALRRGIYGEEFEYQDPLVGNRLEKNRWTWFAADRNVESANILVSSDDLMIRHERINFQATNRWSFFSVEQEKIFNPSQTSDLDSRAMADLNSYVSGASKENRRALPVQIWLNQQIYFDRVKSQKRSYLENIVDNLNEANKEAIEAGRDPVAVPELPEPWSEISSDLGLSLWGNSVGYSSSWNLYNNLFSKSVISFSFVPLWENQLSVGYELEKKPQIDLLGRLSSKSTRIKSIGLQSQSIGNLTAVLNYSNRQVEDSSPPAYSSKLGMEYVSPSDCWGLSLVRLKDYDKTEKLASWRLELNVILMGEKRSLPNMSGAVLKLLESHPSRLF